MKNQDKKIEWMGRAGCAARALVYALLGVLAILLTFEEGGALTDSRGVLHRVLAQPFGKFLLGVVAVGLFFFAAWRTMQAIRDYDRKGRGFGGMIVRVGFGFSALAYAALGYYAFNLIFQLSKPSKQSGEEQMARTLMDQEFGAFLLGGVALIIVAVGIGQIYLAFSGGFKEGLKFPRSARWLSLICKLGISARGLVFCLMGWLFLQAAWHANSSEAQGVKGVWKFLAEQEYGRVLVVVMALGFLAFSVFGFTEAVYRRVGARAGRASYR